MRRLRMLIDGRPVAGATTFTSRNPYTGQDWAEVPDGSPADVDDAVAAARAAFAGEWGRTTGFELVVLRRCDIDLNTGTVYVRRRLAQLRRGGSQEGPPKSVAGVRNVALPPFLVDDIRDHIAEHAGAGPDGLIFRGEKGAILRRGNFGRATSWPETVVKAGLPAGFHFHDLRHTGNQLAANSGATTRELMHRMGHGSMRAALVYQHASTERDRRIADEMAAMVERERHAGTDDQGDDDDPEDGAA